MIDELEKKLELVENPVIDRDRPMCGVTYFGGTGIEWICIKEPHAKVYFRNRSSGRHHRGDPIFSTAPSVDRHYMVNRWPRREKESSENGS